MDRLVQTIKQNAAPEIIDLSTTNAVVLTGGTGALAQLLLKDFIKKGVNKFSLLSRNEPNAELQNSIDKYTQDGIEIQCLQADVSQESELQFAWKKIKQRFGKVGGIVHCAGQTKDSLLASADQASSLAVFRTKYDATKWLDNLSADEPLNFFVVFGSITGVLGNLGQSNYAFANGAVAGLVKQRTRDVLSGNRQGHQCLFTSANNQQ